MNKIQLKLIELSTKKNIWSMSLRAIGNEIDVKNAATIKYHLDQLKEKNILKKPSSSEELLKLRNMIMKSQESTISIPILGSANCGIAMLLAEEMFEGYLRVSKSLLEGASSNLFALKAEGNSMNLATLEGNNIEEGDFLIIDANKVNPKNGKYILSIIDGCANIKKFVKDEERNIIALVSESTNNYPPIYIHPNDNYLINGEVIKVIKNPELN